MATRKNFLFLGGKDRVTPLPSNTGTLQFEFDEAELWSNSSNSNNNNNNSEFAQNLEHKFAIPKLKKPSKRGVSATSLPMNIPDWSKILGDEYGGYRRHVDENNEVVHGDYDDHHDVDDADDDCGIRIPPHEYLARTRVASFSVHEGVGRTLKGRDLSRVRNAIWKQTGFED